MSGFNEADCRKRTPEELERDRRVTRLMEHAACSPDINVVCIEYEDRLGRNTVRVISPYNVFYGQVMALCLGREEVRCFDITRILSAELVSANDVLMPEPITEKGS